MAAWPYNTKAWRDLRRAKLSAQAVCEVCEKRGRSVLADTVDHIVAINAGGDPFPPLSGLMSLCAECHNSKTARMDRGNSKGTGRWKGCDVDGNPIDPDDDWFGPRPSQDGRRPALDRRCTQRKELVSSETISENDRWV